MNRARDWLAQARLNLRHANHSRDAGDHAWACFAAHQAAEAALKALHLARGQVAWGHSIRLLLDALPDDVKPDDAFIERVAILDRLYIPTRSPDAHPAGPAGQHYTAKDAEEAIRLASEVVDYCASQGLEDRPPTATWTCSSS
ncbi:HEPN domain-containing protein [Thermaerobacter sp. FW80]|uniref:HEPN domain-containing protein n=1 Tax=Thermaerobacter sp. FW80 TaxID=2546351 RepID=UPI0010756A36|nr:HEPN domain-containing protein [Thermaerobacter sp. FW80]QBS37595.1 HEPN domain-containing protein [Thermaerobacter sp. FW80]